MRIVLVSDWFSEVMGYSENCLPKALAELGHEVHLVTSNTQPYFDTPGYRQTYEPFIGPGIVATGVKQHDGYLLHRLPHARTLGRLRIKGLRSVLSGLRPDIVQTFETFSLTTLEAALAQPKVGYKLFLESHIHASVLGGRQDRRRVRRLKWLLYRATVGRLVSHVALKCYPISADAAKIAVELLGMSPQKTEISSLGVDTAMFRPRQTQTDEDARAEKRRELGFSASDIVCIYTGRFSPAKGPQILAEAIGRLVEAGGPFRGLFVGSGTDEEVAALQAYPGAQLHPFLPTRELAPFYWAADIGVWPKQESTSQLDAMATGLPIIISHRTSVPERIEGNGLTYLEGDSASLAASIRQLRVPEVRRQMGEIGAGRVQAHFSWRQIAQNRVRDYMAAIAMDPH